MRRTMLWRYRGPLLQWGAFLLALAAVAAGLYVTLPPEPRWESVGEPREVFNAGHGRIAAYRKVDGGIAGPVQLLDVATGTEIARFLSDGQALYAAAHSEDGRYFVGLVKGIEPKMRGIHGVDLYEQREWHVDVPLGPFQVRSAIFSPRCNCVARLVEPLDDAPMEQSYVLRETVGGAIVARVRIPAAADHIGFSHDGSRFVLEYHDKDNTSHIRVVSTRSGQAATLDKGRVLAVAPDGQCVIAHRDDERIWVGALTDGSWHCSLDGARFDGVARIGHNILRGGIQRAHGEWVRTTDLRLAKAPSSFTSSRTSHNGPAFSADGRHLLWCQLREEQGAELAVYDADSGKPRWRQTWTEIPAQPRFTGDCQRVMVPLPDSEQLEVRDLATGTLERTIALPGIGDESSMLTYAERTLAVAVTQDEEEPFWLWANLLEWLPDRPARAPLMAVRVFDFATGNPIAAVTCEDTCEWWLTEDGRNLITVYPESGVMQTIIRCWDVPPRRPLRWIVGVPLALGVGLVSLHFGWRRWRRRRAPAPPPQGATSCA